MERYRRHPDAWLTISSRLEQCSGCEAYVEKAREHELTRLEALARQEVWEAVRRQRRIEDAKNFDDPRAVPAPVRVQVDGVEKPAVTPP